MKNGEVKFYNRTKQFGFIKDTDSNDEYFFHISAVEGEKEPRDGQGVQFEGEMGDKGLRASKVVLGSASKPKSNSDDESDFDASVQLD